MTDFSKFIGRKAQQCRRCSGELHFVNKLGGIQCEKCSPAKRESDVLLRLRIEGGAWQDASKERFDLIDLPTETELTNGATSPPAAQASLEKTEVSKVYHGIRGPNGELSEQQMELFSSEMIWQQKDQLIVLKPKVRFVDRLSGRRK